MEATCQHGQGFFLFPFSKKIVQLKKDEIIFDDQKWNIEVLGEGIGIKLYMSNLPLLS